MLTPYALRTEYLVNPIGLDVDQPRFYWKLEGSGKKQTAYRIVVRSGSRTVWDSGKVESDETTHIEFGGSAGLSPHLDDGLQSVEPPSMTRFVWTVETWDDKGQAAKSKEAFWETGIRQNEWDAKWIGGDVVGAKHTTAPAPYLRKSFTLVDKPVWARLYVTALGVYEAHLNGKRVGKDIFAPGWTDYRKRVRYQAYDVTSLVKKGANALGAILGDGWYCGNVGMDGRQIYGDKPRLLARLVIRLQNGEELAVVTDESWQFAYGPLAESDLLMGESYDARLELKHWDVPESEGRRVKSEEQEWRPVVVFPDPRIQISDTRHPLPQITEIVKPKDDPKTIHGWPGPRYIYNLGQNVVGRVKVKLRGEKGKTIKLRFAERLDEKGDLYTASLRTARATDFYTFRSDDVEEYEPTFTFHGFQYIEISGPLAEPPTKKSLEAHVIGTNTTPTGSFECSDPLLNRLQKNIQWGQRGNFLEAPTDCPQRDERLGWTGDAQVFIRTATHNMDVAAFFTKWIQDIADAQTESGSIPAVVPSPDSFSGDGGPAWADAAVICPWTIYLAYGDERILEEHYKSYQRFVDFLEKESKDGIRAYEGYPGFRGFGDWLNTRAETPNDLIGTAFFAYSAGILSKMSKVLGKDEEAAKYNALQQRAKEAFNRRYVTPDGLVASGSQTSYVLALRFDLLPQDKRDEALNALVTDIGRRDWHLSTGFVGTSYVPGVLSDNGRADVAYKLLLQKTWPSWLYPVTVGATTIWERWDGWTADKSFQTPEMNSFNHYAYGAVGEWLYSKVAGLDLDASQPGYKRVLFHPTPGEGLTRAKAILDSIHGPISAEWEIKGGKFRYEVALPPNTTGVVMLPSGLKDAGPIEVGPGKHTFERPWKEGVKELKIHAKGADAPV